MRRHLPALLCAAAALALLFRAWVFCSEVLQLDLSAYVSAAQAVRFHLDPYRTYPDHAPPIWDGKAEYTHSRFLYPPLVAHVFLPFALVPYATAKWIFTVCSLAALLGSLGLVWRETGAIVGDDSTRVAEGRSRLWLLLAFVLSAYPVLTLLERGQVDAITLLLVVAAWSTALGGTPPGTGSGLLLALATLLKLNAAYLVLFWALRRWWRGVLGFALGALALLLLTVAIDGPGALRDYVTSELPRISRYGEEGTAVMRLPPEGYARLRDGAPEGFVAREGRLYRMEGFGFVANASGARVLARSLGARHARAWFSALSLLIVAGALAFMAWAVGSGHGRLDANAEVAYLAAALTAVLLAGPLTWTMNVVWLVVAGVLLARAWPPKSPAEARALVGLGLGLGLAWMPDQYFFGSLFASPPRVGDYKYVLGELVVFVCLGLWFLSRRNRKPGLSQRM